MEMLGDLIHQERIQKEMTMSKLAKASKVSIMYISDLENGKRFPTRGESLNRIAACLQLNPKVLLEAASYSKLQNSIQGSASKIAQGKLALARKIISSNLDPDKVKRITSILEGVKRR
jgi:transcriptional regulator with XRE-family HTH domain